MTYKIDPALVKLTSESTNYYLTGFGQKGDPGYALIQTSTCKDGELARVRIYTPQEWTPMLHASITARFADLTDNSTYCYKQRLYYAGLPYDRTESTVKAALKATGYYSTIAKST
jgi:hypothetical protein